MPTAARLMAALCLGVAGYVISMMVIPLMPESTQFGRFIPLNIALGLCVGWVVMGKRAGQGITAAINNGLSGIFVLMLWGVFIQAANKMVGHSLDRRFDGPLEAIYAVFKYGMEFVLIIATVPMGIVLAVLAVVSGLLTEFVSKRWR